MDTFVPAATFDPQLFKGSTLILPSVSIGNVPQLTCDLLIHTLKLERCGFIEDNAVMPVAGGREEGQPVGIAVPVEVFQSEDHRWTVIQQRAPTFRDKRQQFINNLVTFVERYQFSNVILLTSMDATRRLDVQINSMPFRLLSNPSTNAVAERAQALGVSYLENVEKTAEQETGKKGIPALPGAGIARPLFARLAETNVPTTLFLIFALEGAYLFQDNVPDSIQFVNMLNTVLELKSAKDTLTSWTPPKSWEYLFGTPFNAELYQ
ncbi:Proteasome assembly chaperone 2 [Apophysomyces ossiformis]|uniref:Proteasome assembly chaperone 2 n=1 Tax=Apophysomyces ossiformis TaxID=679940 RepID=A0A8H7BWT5_9FUNG|nr:Proteasome assembly chaperone 2 [Apophysomyces ossiformis]